MIPELPGLRDLAARYDAVICDVWGVVHDGLNAHPSAVDALRRYRAGGGRVLLLSNAARPGAAVARHMEAMGATNDAFDAILTSGDATRLAIQEAAARGVRRIFHLGPDRNLPTIDGAGADVVGADDAELCVCTGLVDDDVETPDAYADLLSRMRARGLEMLCANPDLMAERGPRLVFCAGSLAQAYEAIGGRVTYFGKPHAPVYARSLAMLGEVSGHPPARVLAIGDGLRTDVRGANAAGLDCLLITAGLHAGEFGPDALRPDPGRIEAVLSEFGLAAIGWQARLRW